MGDLLGPHVCRHSSRVRDWARSEIGKFPDQLKDTFGDAKKFLQWVRESGFEVEDRWPTEHDIHVVRRRLYFEKHPSHEK